MKATTTTLITEDEQGQCVTLVQRLCGLIIIAFFLSFLTGCYVLRPHEASVQVTASTYYACDLKPQYRHQAPAEAMPAETAPGDSRQTMTTAVLPR